jgi:NAD(P)-dependent dehydrogenase (short-subunit alcohol dehydrogenase family)
MHSISPGNRLWETPVFEINGRHILVTGGSSGFGRHFARFLANNGAHVTLAARRAEALAAGVAEINGSGGKAQCIVAGQNETRQMRRRNWRRENTIIPWSLST